MASKGALDNVRGPSRIMEAGTPFRALHTTVTCKKITAHKLGGKKESSQLGTQGSTLYIHLKYVHPHLSYNVLASKSNY